MQLLKTIANFQASQCYSPTITELAIQLDISRSTVFEHLDELKRKKLLSASSGRARSLKITSKAQKLLKAQAENSAPSPQVTSDEQNNVPLLGRVAAGAPIEAIENSQYLPVDSLFKREENFALQVTGDSMINDGILDGDYVICRKSETANNGQIVVALVEENNATLKRFYKEKTSVRLQPANDRLEPIYSTNCRINAVVVGLIRKF
jgi:repressor LexA